MNHDPGGIFAGSADTKGADHADTQSIHARRRAGWSAGPGRMRRRRRWGRSRHQGLRRGAGEAARKQYAAFTQTPSITRLRAAPAAYAQFRAAGDDDGHSQKITVLDGSWMRRTAAQDGPQSTPQIGYFRVGTIDRNNVSTYGTGDARYEGKALGHYTNDDGDWLEWNGSVSLEANFAPEERQISGTIDTRIGATLADDAARMAAYGRLNRGLGTISLQKTSIDGSANGQSRISGSTNNVGTWEADFHGTAINNSPNGVTGEFKTEREELSRTVNNAKVLDQSKATIQGVFGAHNVGQLQDTDLE